MEKIYGRPCSSLEQFRPPIVGDALWEGRDRQRWNFFRTFVLSVIIKQCIKLSFTLDTICTSRTQSVHRTQQKVAEVHTVDVCFRSSRAKEK